MSLVGGHMSQTLPLRGTVGVDQHGWLVCHVPSMCLLIEADTSMSGANMSATSILPYHMPPPLPGLGEQQNQVRK